MTLPVRAEVGEDADVIHLRRYGPDGAPLNAMSLLATLSMEHARDLMEELDALLERRAKTGGATRYGITK